MSLYPVRPKSDWRTYAKESPNKNVSDLLSGLQTQSSEKGRIESFECRRKQVAWISTQYCANEQIDSLAIFGRILRSNHLAENSGK